MMNAQAAVRMCERVPAPVAHPWIQVGSIPELGNPRDVDSPHDDDAPAAEDLRKPTRPVCMVQSEPGEGHIGSQHRPRQMGDTPFPVPLNISDAERVPKHAPLPLYERRVS